MKSERKSNFELLRIISMLMIILWHILLHGKVLASMGEIENNTISGNHDTLVFVRILCAVAVNCFVLISGYFNIKLNIMKALKKIYLPMLFYSIIITLIGILFLNEVLSKTLIFSMIFPLISKKWWFLSTFIALMLIAPYLNKMLNSLSDKECFKLSATIFVIFELWSTLGDTFNSIKWIGQYSSGYSIIHFIVLYIFGDCIRRYSSVLSKIKRYYWLAAYFICSIINTFATLFWGYKQTFAYNNPLVLLASIFLFIFFTNIKIYHSVINVVATTVLGIYMIHDHPIVRKHIYKYFNTDDITFYSDNFVYLRIMFLAFAIFIVCGIIEFLRIKLFNMVNKLLSPNV